MRLGAWLLSRGKINEEQLQRALQHQQFFGGRLGSSLIKLGHIDEDVLGAYLSDVAGAPYAPPSRLDAVPPEVVALVPARLASQYRVVPLELEGRRLRLAMRDPKDLIALDEIAFLTGMMIEPYVATDFRIQQALQRYYQVSSGTQSLPVAGGPAFLPAPPPKAERPVPAPPPAASSPVALGFDGFPLDADPGPILNPPPVAEIGPRERTVPPTSLEQWRQAQDDIPDEIPKRDPRWAAPPALAAAPAPSPAPLAARREAGPEPLLRTAPVPAATPVVTPVVPASSTAGAQSAAPDSANLEAAALRLQRAETRDDVFAVILDFVAARFRRSALFVVQGDRVTGWSGRGDGIEPIRVRQVSVPLDRPSLFSFFRGGSDSYQGPVSDLPANTRFYLDLGCPAPAHALLLPLRIKDRPAVILYADHAGESGPAPEVATLRRLLAKASLALEILILKTKILTL